MTRVTVLMPTLNVQTFLREALASVATSELAQNGRIEVVVLDGGSTDRTIEIAESFTPLVRISQERDRGMYDALNRGLTLAEGDVIGWLNGDDLFSSDGFSTLLKKLEGDPALDVAYGDLQLRDERAGGQTKLVRHESDALGLIRAGELERGWVTPLCAAWRKSSLQKIGAWSAEWRAVGDLELWLRAAATGATSGHVDAVIGTFRAHDDSMTSGGKQSRRVLDEDLRLCGDLLARALPNAMHDAIAARHHRHLRSLVWIALKARDLRGALDAVKLYGRDDHIVPLVIEQLADSVRRLRS